MAGAGAGEPETCLAPLVGGTDVARPGPPGSAWPARGTVQVLGPLTEAALCVFLASWGQGKLPGVPSMSARSRAVDGLCASTLASLAFLLSSRVWLSKELRGTQEWTPCSWSPAPQTFEASLTVGQRRGTLGLSLQRAGGPDAHRGLAQECEGQGDT